MHTTGLRSHDFRIEIAGAPATIEDLFPGFDEHDRLGIVITSDHGAAGAATLILAAVTAFYDRLRARGEPFFAYADYFAFHVGRPRGSLRELDVYPEHKEVVVPAEAEAVLQAINDRGVTRLLIPDAPPRPLDLAAETAAGARRRIRTVLAYRADGNPAGGDRVVTGSAASAQFVEQMLQSTGAARTGPAPGTPQTFRPVDLESALGMLQPGPG
jgi:hypothetical protein